MQFGRCILPQTSYITRPFEGMRLPDGRDCPMYRLLTTLILIATFTCARPAAGQSVRVVTPQESVERGLANSHQLRAARARADEAAGRLRQARAARLPSLTGQASYSRLGDNVPSVDFALPGLDSAVTILPVERDRYHAEIRAEQTLFAGFRVRNEIEAARRMQEAAAAVVEQEAAEVAYSVREAYWRLYRAEAALAAMQTAIDQVEAHLRDIRNRYDEGAALRSELLTARARRSEVQLARIDARNAVRVARLELNRLVGLPLDAATATAAEVEADSLDARLDGLVEQVVDAQPQLRALRMQVAALDARLDAARGQWLPELALTGRYVYARPNEYFFAEQDEFNGIWEAGVLMRWSLFDGGARRGEIQSVRAQREAARAQLEEAQEEVVVAVTQQYLELERSREALAAARENVDQAREVLRVLQVQYEDGVALSAQVLDAEEALREAELRMAEARAARALARAGILRLLGHVDGGEP